MCGIAGEFVKSGASAELLRGMIATLNHRGPDGGGFHIDGEAGLAHARLSIVDLTSGAQPMTNEDRTLWITFNGEIFNYLEIREALEQRGHQFATHSDTEVIVHLFEEKGPECVHELNGQWAFAIWDARNRSMFLSRDRLGMLPLFYTQASDMFLFASEIKALFAVPDVSRALDPESLNEIFTFWVTLPPRTAFLKIFELPPGYSMMVSGRGMHSWAYWELQFPTVPSRDESELKEELIHKLTVATRLRLRSDVAVGAYLSGGLDSTLIVSLICQVSSVPVRTFSLEFDDREYDESLYQREAADYLGTNHACVRCSGDDIQRVFPDVIWHTEKPVLRTAAAPMFLLSQLVQQSGMKVVLTGEGADEMFGGYDIFKEAKIRRFWATQPFSRWRPLLLRKLYPYLRNIHLQSDSYLRAFFHVESAGPFFSHHPRWDLTSRLKVFLSPGIRTADPTTRLLKTLPLRFEHWDAFSQTQYLEAAHLLPGYILSSQCDRVAMAHSVEARFPFLDKAVVEFASCLPPHLKMKVLNEKYLLKQASSGLIPESVRTRSKQPYRSPEASSFFGPKREPYVDELLSPERIRRDGVFDPRPVQHLVRKFRDGLAIGVKDSMALTGILSTQILMDRFL